MSEKINVRIKQFPPPTEGAEPKAATPKVFLRGNAETRAGCRPLEPGEVVALDVDEAELILRRLPFELEMTVGKPTRPLFFENADQAALTSRDFNPSTAGRAEAAKLALAKMLEQANSEGQEAIAEVINDLDSRGEAIKRREIELGIRQDDDSDTLEARLDEDLEDYTPADNKQSKDEIDEARAQVDDDAQSGAAEELAQPEGPAPVADGNTRRRRRSVAV